MSGSTTIANSQSRIEALQLQSSAYGVTMQVVYGVNRVAGNLIWYAGFKSIPHTTTVGQGGKGGGVKTQNTTFTYTASVMMGVSEGPITGIPRIWRGKKLYKGGWLPTQISRSTEGFFVPLSGPMVFTTAHADRFLQMHDIWRTEHPVRKLIEGIDYSIEDGVITILEPSMRGYFFAVIYGWASGTMPATALERLGMTLNVGTLGQSPWSYLTGSYPSQALGYSGLATVAAQDYDLGTGAQVENHLFEVQGKFSYHLSADLPDVDPSLALGDLLTSGQYGANFPSSRLEFMERWSNYCVSIGLLMSPAFEEQMPAAEALKHAARLTNTAVVWSAGLVKMVPYGDTVQTGNGVTYTPNVTPVYDLADDDFMDTEQPVKVSRNATSDAYNHVRLEFRSRGEWDALNQTFTGNYAVEIAEAKDQANIDTLGLRTMPTITAHWICDPTVARLVAQLILQRSLYVRNTYEFRLNWKKSLLEPMDLVTLTDPGLQMDRLPVRLIEVEEGEDGSINCRAENFPIGAAAATLYPSQAGVGYQADYNADPGMVDAPVFFEAPVERTVTGLEVYAAVKGSAPLWGGCSAWVSLDGTNYRRISTIYGPARYGALTGPIAAGAMPVATSGQLISGSSTDAAALATLCYVGGGNPEYLAYETATLTGAGAYTLSGLVRAAYGTSQAAAHLAGDSFVRVDDAIAKSGDLDLSFIGRTIYFKFTSFNVYGAAEQTLADVSAYSYTITGAMVSLPPSLPTGGSFALEPFGLRASIARNPEPDVVAYEWRLGSTWASAAVLEENGGTSYLLAVQTTGSVSVMVAARDALGIYSPPLTISTTLAGPVVNTLTYALSGPNLNLEWTATAGAFAIAGFEVRYGASWAAATRLQQVTASRYTEIVRWGGSRTLWVAGIDARGNYGTPQSLIATIASPGAVTSQRADVVDNNVLLYWQPPATGSLPLERYEVRKGATWAGGAVVGSNGNSTFAAVFEQQAGTYLYWITGYDSANNEGTPLAITATVNQPPDYILRNNFDSVFGGTRTNMYLEGGRMRGPVSLTETWATHFSSRGWASPDSQIAAGYPLYIQPSVTSGAYEEEIDYGVILPSTVVTVTPSFTVLAGSVTMTCTISHKVNVGDPWTVATPGVTSLFIAGGFRYVRIQLSFSCTAGANLIELSGLNVRVANRLKTDSGTFTITNATTGVFVPFNVAFLDADTPICQPAGATPLIPVVDFSDVANPTGFTVSLFNQSGTRVTGSGSWTARGY